MVYCYEFFDQWFLVCKYQRGVRKIEEWNAKKVWEYDDIRDVTKYLGYKVERDREEY